MKNFIEMLREYKEYKRIQDEAEKIAKELRNAILENMEELGTKKAVFGEYKVNVIDKRKETPNRAKLEEVYGDITEFLSVSEYQELRVN